ncbi:MAG TPA: hypothetical protein VFA11_12105 [Acidimicrobiales bacterium]|nr:hypothetical protein [Acidimicrobiales bacterium]
MTRPYFRPAPPEGTASAPCPPGWAAAPAGTWRGARLEVIYDPSRHRVVFLHGPSEVVTRALARSGFSCWDRDGGTEMWVAGASARRPLPSPAGARVGLRRVTGRG